MSTISAPTPPNATLTPRNIPDRLSLGWRRIFQRWETLLLVVAVLIFIFNAFASPYFLDPWSLSDATYNFTEKAIVALAMTFVIIAGDIDLSVASIIALASTAMGAAAAAGLGTPAIVVIGLGVGILCGAFNGFLVTRFQVPSIVATIGTMSLFRGISYVVLGDQAYTKYPSSFAWFGQGYVWWVITAEFAIFAVLSVILGVLLHKTSFGRRVFALGNNPVAARFSGVRVERIRFLLFLMTGTAAGIASVLLTSRLGATRPTIATGMELEAVTMAVLGGVNILGGSGTIPGVVIAAFVMGLVTFGFGLLNVPGIVMSIFVGALLIAVIALPILWRRFARRRA
ncbi:ABC transporter permease [Kaistia dalseonensis]|uniref:Autoinducer 2 import system permease protein LsrD n=1 Tax=Kaistia dalseonensis TaxID=410840 RepID=A0ABU0H7Q9_9HYPH|nr:ABC transporter permease [Kaistia dalseonensis]MCX5495229.1 ABC transporter permease [Kaistia dalseonensis]MDQ0437815.1 rhamnose transport system permease protein [Kaistia dalseonensis]